MYEFHKYKMKIDIIKMVLNFCITKRIQNEKDFYNFELHGEL